MPDILREEQEASGPRHYLDGRPVHAGETLEIRFAAAAKARLVDTNDAQEGIWLRGRYEWNFQPGSRPVFYLELGNAEGGGCAALAEFRIPPPAILRWPA